MPSKEWLEKYEAVKEKLRCKKDLDAYFTEKEIGGTPIDTLEIGSVSFPTGEVIACDPLVDLDGARPYIQTIPAGRYPVAICVVPSEKYGDRYACVKVAVSGEKPVRYELGLCGDEELDEIEEDEFFGFCVDAGMGCVADAKTQEAFKKYWEQREINNIEQVAESEQFAWECLSQFWREQYHSQVDEQVYYASCTEILDAAVFGDVVC